MEPETTWNKAIFDGVTGKALEKIESRHRERLYIEL